MSIFVCLFLIITACGGTAEEEVVVEETTPVETIAPATTVVKETAWYPVIRTANKPTQRQKIIR